MRMLAIKIIALLYIFILLYIDIYSEKSYLRVLFFLSLFLLLFFSFSSSCCSALKCFFLLNDPMKNVNILLHLLDLSYTQQPEFSKVSEGVFKGIQFKKKGLKHLI